MPFVLFSGHSFLLVLFQTHIDRIEIKGRILELVSTGAASTVLSILATWEIVDGEISRRCPSNFGFYSQNVLALS